jgi:GDP-L-fucose synthase
MDDNLTMYYNLLQFRKHYTKLIHFGSGAETYMPKEPYGYSKKVIAKSILNQDSFYNIKIFGLFDENELDTRFIKANIKRYIAKEPMQIYRSKLMDFFYMQDLIKVVEYYINTKEPPKEFDCAYVTYYTLAHIAENIINSLDDHKVDVQIQETGSDLYISEYREFIPIEFIGLKEGIKNVYNKLKNEAN